MAVIFIDEVEIILATFSPVHIVLGDHDLAVAARAEHVGILEGEAAFLVVGVHRRHDNRANGKAAAASLADRAARRQGVLWCHIWRPREHLCNDDARPAERLVSVVFHAFDFHFKSSSPSEINARVAMMKRSIWTLSCCSSRAFQARPACSCLAALHPHHRRVDRQRPPYSGAAPACYDSCDSELPQLFSETDLDVELENAGSNVLVVVDFFATWCGPCKKIAPILEQLAASTEKSGKVKFFAVDVDQARELAAEKGVRSMPTILFYKNEKLIKTIVGGDIAGIKAEVSKATTPALLAYLRSETLMLAAALAYMGVTLTPLKKVLPPALQFA